MRYKFALLREADRNLDQLPPLDAGVAAIVLLKLDPQCTRMRTLSLLLASMLTETTRREGRSC